MTDRNGIEYNPYQFFFGSVKNEFDHDIVLPWSNGNKFVIRPGEPIFLPKQIESYNAANDPKTEILFMGGALGGSKSHAGRAITALKLIEWSQLRGIGMVPDKPVKGAIFSENYPVLRGRHIDTISSWPSWLGKYYKSDKMFVFGDGNAILKLLNLDQPEKYASDEFAIAFVDELTFNTEKTFNDVNSRVRWPGLSCVTLCASNPGRIGHCVPHGEVLTPNGWVDIRTMKVGDPVYTILSDGDLQETIVDQVHSQYYEGDMMQVSARGLNIECTPDHQIAKISDTKKDRGKRKFSLTKFKDLPGQTSVLRSVKWQGVAVESFTVPYTEKRKPKLNQPYTLGIDRFCEFMGWFLSEGYTTSLNDKTKQRRVGIAQMKKEHRASIASLLTVCGFKYKESQKGFDIYSTSWWNYLRQFGKCRQKFIPTWMKMLPQEQLQILFDALMKGDGHRASSTSGQYYTISKKLADDVTEVAVKLGYTVHLSFRFRENRVGLSYCVSFKTTKSGGTEILTGRHVYNVNTKTKRKSDIRKNNFAGNIYCIGIKDTHSFVIRQHGSVWISGNSWCKRRLVNPKTREQGVVFIPSTLKDNPFLNSDPKYMNKLKRYPPKIVKAWVDGSWDQFEGQFFPDLNEEVHLIKPFRIPQEWMRFRVIDHGFKHPTAALWGAVDPEGNLYCYLNYEALETTADINKRIIHELSSDWTVNYGLPARPKERKVEKYVATIGDPSLKRVDGSALGNKTPWEVYNDPSDGIGSFFVIEADRDRIEGWHSLQMAFHYEVDSEQSEVQEMTIYKTKPQIYIFDVLTQTAFLGQRNVHHSNALWEELNGLVYDEKKANEDAEKSKGYYDIGEGDDSPECLRYLWNMVGVTDLSHIEMERYKQLVPMAESFTDTDENEKYRQRLRAGTAF